MKTIRKSAVVLAVLIALLAVTACSKTENSSSAAAQTTAAVQTTATAAPQTQEKEPEAVQTPVYEFPSDIFNTGAVGANGAAACASPLAAQIAVDILERGGNAIDAAVGMIYAVGLLEPAASGVGGAGQMTVYLADQD